MTAQLRETQFGHFVRFVTNKKLLRFPDEDDPSLWRASLGREGLRVPNDSLEKGESGDAAEHNRSPQTTTLQDYEAQASTPSDLVMQQASDATYDHIIGWYGPDDPEASESIKHPSVYRSECS